MAKPSKDTLIQNNFAARIQCAVFGYENKTFKILLRSVEEHWELPAKVLEENEEVGQAALQVLHLAGISYSYLFRQSQVAENAVFLNGARILDINCYAIAGATKARGKNKPSPGFRWFPVDELPEIQLPQKSILTECFNQVKSQCSSSLLGIHFFSNSFTIYQLQVFFETLLQKQFNRPNFRRKLMATQLFEAIETREDNVRHRPAQLHRLNLEKYEQMTEQGFEMVF